MPTQTQGSSPAERDRNPYMFFSMHLTADDFSPERSALGLVPLLRSFAPASAASRSERAQQGNGGVAQAMRAKGILTIPAPRACIDLSSLISLPRQENETAAPAQGGAAVACASSFNPRTVLDQSAAQPEPLTPSAPNSNRCQSVGPGQQLVFVRMS